MACTPNRRWSIVTRSSSANLGSGFDLLAIALDLTLEILAEPAVIDSIERSGTFQGMDMRDDDDLVRIAARGHAEHHGWTLPPLTLRMHSTIPIERGLGSSSAAILAGIELANAIHGMARDPSSMLRYATQLEGHADNAAACLHGGLTWVSPETGQVTQLACSPRWRFTLCWPEVKVSTQAARDLLPHALPLPVATRHADRFARLVLALQSGDENDLRAGLHDEVHVPFRATRIPGFDEVRSSALEAGAIGATLSGSGSCLLAISTEEGDPASIGRAMVDAFARHGLTAAMHVASLGGPPEVRCL
ncbi:MAG: homoserine kinase [Planctomycetes bacterium]|nr:homoserine kinase [Planctomycetota bacterium]MCB9891565.1 homoserine kinase [Planctomycetota bacterium]